MIRKAVRADLEDILKVYRAAKAYMRATGNLTQWEDGYPDCVLEGDIEKGQLYVLCDDGGEVRAAFAFILGEDPTYAYIEKGSWRSDEPYGTIHRIGSDGKMKGVFSLCLDFCSAVIPHLRADTHQDNKTMQHVLEKHGFVRRGIIYVEDGTPRIAYDFCI